MTHYSAFNHIFLDWTLPPRPNVQVTKHVHMKPADIAEQKRSSLWPLVIAGAAVVVTLSWMDPDGTSKVVTEWLGAMHSVAQQWFAIIRANLHAL